MLAQVVNAGLGIWLMAAPAILGYTGSARTNDRIVGPLVAASAVIALHEATRPLRWVNLALGLWLVLAPGLLGYQAAPLFNSTVVGLFLTACAAVRGTSRQRLGGGWASLWKTNLAPGG